MGCIPPQRTGQQSAGLNYEGNANPFSAAPPLPLLHPILRRLGTIES